MKNTSKLNNSVLFCALTLGSSAGVYAIEPSPVQVGIFDIIPTIDVNASRMSNLLYSPDNEIDTNVYTVAPKVQAMVSNGTREYLIEAEIIDGTYSESSEDDYTDWRIGASADIELNARNLLELSTSVVSTHEARGTGYSEGNNIPQAPEEYDEFNLGMGYEYGASDALGRLAFDLTYYDREYSTNRAVTQFRDRDDFRVGLGFFLSVLSRADILVEYRYAEIDYGTNFNVASDLDSEEQYVYLGLAWEATSSISGSVRLGYGQKDFASAAREDSDNPSWEIDLLWQPLTYSSVSFGANKRFNEASGVGNSIETTDMNLTWNHTWSNRISTMVDLRREGDDYDGFVRDDTLQSVSIGLSYSYARWLDFNASISKSDKDSSVSTFDFDQSIYSIGFEASL